MNLPPPAHYFPLRGGRYTIAPALRPLGTSFGNGAADECVFQFDRTFPEYRANKLTCREAPPRKHLDVSDPLLRHVAGFLLERLPREHPDLFALAADGDRRVLECRLTGERLTFDAETRLLQSSGAVRYENAFDALACQVQEDLAVMREGPGSENALIGYHICAPTHWAPEEKAGCDFAAIHVPVPGIEPINRAASGMVAAMVHRGPFVRFGWGLDTDRRLNRHPRPPAGVTEAEWAGPPFDATRPSPFVLRVERQVMWGFPEVSLALFSIRVYLTEGAEIRANPEYRAALRSAVDGMSPESRRYKGIAPYAEALLQWLGDP
jgi:hypothetical protein